MLANCFCVVATFASRTPLEPAPITVGSGVTWKSDVYPEPAFVTVHVVI